MNLKDFLKRKVSVTEAMMTPKSRNLGKIKGTKWSMLDLDSYGFSGDFSGAGLILTDGSNVVLTLQGFEKPISAKNFVVIRGTVDTKEMAKLAEILGIDR